MCSNLSVCARACESMLASVLVLLSGGGSAGFRVGGRFRSLAGHATDFSAPGSHASPSLSLSLSLSLQFRGARAILLASFQQQVSGRVEATAGPSWPLCTSLSLSLSLWSVSRRPLVGAHRTEPAGFLFRKSSRAQRADQGKWGRPGFYFARAASCPFAIHQLLVHRRLPGSPDYDWERKRGKERVFFFPPFLSQRLLSAQQRPAPADCCMGAVSCFASNVSARLLFMHGTLKLPSCQADENARRCAHTCARKRSFVARSPRVRDNTWLPASQGCALAQRWSGRRTAK